MYLHGYNIKVKDISVRCQVSSRCFQLSVRRTSPKHGGAQTNPAPAPFISFKGCAQTPEQRVVHVQVLSLSMYDVC